MESAECVDARTEKGRCPERGRSPEDAKGNGELTV